MSTLRFYAAGDACLPRRTADGQNMPVSVGAPVRYVGRKHDPKTRGYPATKEPYECDSGTREAAYLKKHIGSLVAADAETAAACGVKFVPHEFKDGVWVPKAEEAKPAPAAKADAPKSAGKADV